ncbi:MAG: HAD-IA family hydrolase [Betaproteobacteria bacterium]|nr:HAD-IA family hydrolase [Betaproteobacteria bacterium]
MADAPAGARALPIRAVLFDLDGTLADTAPDLAAALNRVRGDRGLAPLPYATLRPHASHGARGLVGAGFGVAPGDDGFPLLRDTFLAHYEAALCVESTLFDDVAALLAEIEARGLAWGIVTNKAARFTQPLLAMLPPLARAGTVVSGDTTPHAKPHPEPLLHAARELGVAPECCLYVGDAERDIAAGVAAGMPAIVAGYGYLDVHEAPARWPAVGIIDRPAALLDWLPPRG